MEYKGGRAARPLFRRHGASAFCARLLLATTARWAAADGVGAGGNLDGRADQGLCQQSDHQLVARVGPRGGRERPEGERGLFADYPGDRPTIGVAHINGNANFPSERHAGRIQLRHRVSIRAVMACRPQETVFDGYKTINSDPPGRVRRPSIAREQLRYSEQSTLLDGVTAYMDVLRDTALLELAAQQRCRSCRSSCAKRGTGSRSAKSPEPTSLRRKRACRPRRPRSSPRRRRWRARSRTIAR